MKRIKCTKNELHAKNEFSPKKRTPNGLKAKTNAIGDNGLNAFASFD